MAPSTLILRSVHGFALGAVSKDDWAGNAEDWLHRLWIQFAQWASHTGSEMIEYLSQPSVLAFIVAWAITFTVVCTIVMCLGFGPGGILAGSMAAAFQSWMYGAFTPAGGLFATLTCVGMTGWLMPGVALLAAIVATGVAGVTSACFSRAL